MKKHFLLTLGLLLTTLPLWAQSTSSPWQIGIYAGPSNAWLRTDNRNVKNNGTVAGFEYGLMVDYMFSDNRYAISTGLNISHRGGRLNYADTLVLRAFPNEVFQPGASVRYRIQYLEIPLHLRLRVTQASEQLIPFAQLGFNTGFKVGARADLPGRSEVEKVREDTNVFTFGLAVGAGVEYKINDTNRLMVAVLFNNGFTDILSRHRRPEKLNKFAHNYLNFRLGFFF
jgi:hypothetical protein